MMRITTLQNAVFKWVARIFVPGIAEQMKREGTLSLSDADADTTDLADHVIVEDRGSDVTIFVFSGLAVLFAGMPRFEFRKLLVEGGHNYNLVFFRDLRRMGYRVTPEGKLGGYEYYEELIHSLKAKLGSKYHVSMGASSGGSAAFYFGSRCGVDQIVAFAPAFPHTCYTSLKSQLQNYFDIPKLFTDPSAYFEVVLVTLGAVIGFRRIAHAVRGVDLVTSQLNAFMGASPRPRATIFYGRRCRPDTKQAKRFAETPGVKLIPVDSGRHNCAADLKKQGGLATAILSEIEEGLRKAGRAAEKAED